MKTWSLQPLRVAIDGGEEDGLVVLHAGVLVAVLVCLREATYGVDQGHWHLEAGFGRCATRSLTFPTLEAALRWMARRLGADPDEATACARAYKNVRNGYARS